MVFEGELPQGGNRRRENPDGERETAGGLQYDVCHLADSARWQGEKARLAALKSDASRNWPVNNGSLDGQRARQETETGGRDH